MDVNMTHDELLARILEGIDLARRDREQVAYDALLAVVELHKPIEGTPYCEGCDLLRRYYPCPTIQAVRKELQ
jgi:hypothetical protein